MILTKVPESETKSSTESGSNNKVPALIPFEEHQRLIDEAAKRASRETLESLRKLERSREREPRGEDLGLGGEESDDDGGEIDFFATKTNKSIKNMVSSVATLKRAFEQPPSKIEDMLYSAFTQNVVQKLSGEGINAKKGWWDEAVSSFAHGLGSRGPELVESLTRNFGSEWVKQTATGLLNPGAVINSGYGGQGQLSGQGSGGGKGGKGDLNQDAVDQIMALDPNNPAHVSAYAEIQGNIDINDARKMLQIHQDIFMNKMKRNAAQQMIDVEPRDMRVNSDRPPNVSVNSDVPPVWAQAMMGKILELENKVNQVCADAGVDTDVVIPKVTIPKISDTMNSVDSSSIGKVQTIAEFQKELEEETRRDNERLSNNVNSGNKWEDDPSAAVGVVTHERRLEEEQMRKRPVHDASVDMIKREMDSQKEKLELKNTTVENFEEKVEIPVDIKTDVDKIEEKVANVDIKEDIKEEAKSNIILVPENEIKEVHIKAPKSVIDEPKQVVKEFPKGSQGWLKEQQQKKKK